MQTRINSNLSASSPKQKAALYFALSQIEDFHKNPDKYQSAPSLEMPPGAPIAMPDNEFEF